MIGLSLAVAHRQQETVDIGHGCLPWSRRRGTRPDQLADPPTINTNWVAAEPAGRDPDLVQVFGEVGIAWDWFASPLAVQASGSHRGSTANPTKQSSAATDADELNQNGT